MKTIITTLACALVLSSAAFAADPTEDKKAKPLQVGVFATKDAKIQMAVRKGTAQVANIKLLDAQNNILHEDWMSKKSEKYDARFDVSSLPAGQYKLQIEAGGQKIEKQVTIAAQKNQPVKKVQFN